MIRLACQPARNPQRGGAAAFLALGLRGHTCWLGSSGELKRPSCLSPYSSLVCLPPSRGTLSQREEWRGLAAPCPQPGSGYFCSYRTTCAPGEQTDVGDQGPLEG